MKKYVVRDREAGNIIEECPDLQYAESLVKWYEYLDHERGIYEEDFYEVARWDDELESYIRVV